MTGSFIGAAGTNAPASLATTGPGSTDVYVASFAASSEAWRWAASAYIVRNFIIPNTCSPRPTPRSATSAAAVRSLQ